MKTFKEYLTESEGSGNYVCIDSESMAHLFASLGIQEPISGDAPPEGDYHCTLMYSKESAVNCNKIINSIKDNFETSYTATIDHFECFDATPKDGERDSAKSCIVIKLKSQDLHDIHKHLQSMGMDHSYSEYSPHVTLRYNMAVEEAHYYRDKLNAMKIQLNIKLANYKSQPINKNYV
jgi:2'-5' RNA ligase